MEQNNKKTSAFSKIRKNFYKQSSELDKKERRKIIFIALGLFLSATALLLTATLIEASGKGKYVYIYGDYEQSIKNDACFYEEVQLIDMNALANYCGISKEEANYIVTFSVNNTYVSLENGSNIAIVNGIKKEMPAAAQIKNGYCLVPVSIVNDIIFGVTINAGKKSASITKQEAMYIIDKNPKIEYVTDVSQYLEYINSKDEYIYTLVNKVEGNFVDKDFEPDSLVQIPQEYLHEYKHGKEIKLYSITLQALSAMLEDMAGAGINDILVQSAYRTHDYQNMLFENYVNDEINNGHTREEAEALANKYSALPKHSEHRTGLCVDFTTNSIHGVVDDIFETTQAFAWLKENSWKYGFVLRYAAEKESKTGYVYESWHYRFVGFEAASIMYQTGLCYEEYLEIFGAK